MNKEQLIEALGAKDFSPYYKKANEIKEHLYQKDVYIRAIVEFSNHCRMDCSYCGLNHHNAGIERFRMTAEEIIQTGIAAWEAGYQTLVMQSGEDPYFTPKLLGEIIKEIKKTGITITLSCGELPYESYDYLKSCGADRYLLKHECSDPDIYRTLHHVSTWENRIRCLRDLKKIGYETGSGFMIGLPEQTLATIADDICLLADIGCDMAGIGPFIPHPMTPLKHLPSGSTELTKRAVALSRIVMERINLPATTSLGVLDQREKAQIFSCGANVVMKKVTPEPYKSLYEIYPARFKPTNIVEERKELEAQIRALGCVPV